MLCFLKHKYNKKLLISIKQEIIKCTLNHVSSFNINFRHLLTLNVMKLKRKMLLSFLKHLEVWDLT